MRDIVVTLVIFAALPYIFKRPYFGVIMWVWVSTMNPHTQGFGFAATFPFAAIIAAVTLVSLVFSREPKKLPMTPITVVLLLFVFWMNVSTLFAILPDDSIVQWKKVMKIMLMTVVALMLIKTREQIILLIWVLVVSLGFYGVKGGIYTIATAGAGRVWGPTSTFISGNNELALALITCIPLMYYLQGRLRKAWMRYAMTASILLSALAALGSYSRGALLAIAAMLAFLWLKSRHKAKLGVVLAMMVPLMLMFMPDKWSDRMETINTYEQDASAMGRINAWWMAFNLAKDHPLTGGGFAIYDPLTFNLYAPDPSIVRATHSIYFQALGEHGFIGLGLVLLLGLLTWRSAGWVVRRTAGREDLKWAGHLSAMIQVSLIGYGVGAAFLSLLYFDLPYYLLGAVVAMRVLVEQELKRKPAEATPRNSGPAPRRNRLAPQAASGYRR